MACHFPLPALPHRGSTCQSLHMGSSHPPVTSHMPLDKVPCLPNPGFPICTSVPAGNPSTCSFCPEKSYSSAQLGYHVSVDSPDTHVPPSWFSLSVPLYNTPHLRATRSSSPVCRLRVLGALVTSALAAPFPSEEQDSSSLPLNSVCRDFAGGCLILLQ